MWGTVLMIVAFIALVVIHEGGHMVAAKRMKVKVKEFGIGLPPKILRLYTDKSGTSYTFNIIPLGGFVRLYGDNPTQTKNYTRPGSYHASSRWRKIIILIAGILMNFITARFIFAGVLIAGTQPLAIIPDDAEIESYFMPTESTAIREGILTIHEDYPAYILETQPGSWSEEHLLEPQSIITHINKDPVYAHNLRNKLQEYCIDTSCTITWQPPTKSPPHSEQYQCNKKCLLGVVVDTSDVLAIQEIHLPFRKALVASTHEIITQASYTIQTIGSLIHTLFYGSTSDKQSASAGLSGPVGIVGIGSSIAQQHARSQRWILVGMISLALGVFNILPIPALDGGRIIGVLLQKTLHIPPEKFYPSEGWLNTIIMIILLILGIAIMAKDAAQVYCRDNVVSQMIFGDAGICNTKE